MSLTATAFAPLSSRRHWRRRYEDCFAALAPPPRDSLVGRFQGQFVGPWWLRHGVPYCSLSEVGWREEVKEGR